MARKTLSVNERKTTMGISIPFGLLIAFDDLCEASGITRSELVTRLILDAITEGHVYRAPQEYVNQLATLLKEQEV